MMLRWISLVPPGMVAANERRYCVRHAAGAPHLRCGDVEVDALRAELLQPDEQRALQRLAAEQLEERVLGRRLALRELREAPVADELQGLRVDVRGRHQIAVAFARTVLLAHAHEVLDDVRAVVRVVDPQHRALVRERAHRQAPTVVEVADEVLGRHLDVGEEHLVEVRVVVVGQLGDRPVLDAGRPHVDDEDADALVLRGGRIGAHEAEAPVGVLRTRRPHLLPVHDEPVAVEHRPRGERGEVAAGVGLAHAEAPADLGPQRRQREPLLLPCVPWSRIDGVMIDRPCGLRVLRIFRRVSSSK